VIRTVAGLRPFRASGFVIRADRFDDRTIVHNYGHGGGGISLAWGSSELAVEELAPHASPDDGPVAVLGCGIMGLTSARLLQDRGYGVTIYTRDLPPHTTSNVAGGQWSPFTVSTAGQTTPDHDRRFEEAARRSHRRYQALVGPRYGVRWIENYALRGAPGSPEAGPIADLFVDSEEFGPGEHPFAAPWLRRFTTMLIEPGILLPRLMDEFHLRGGRVVVRELRSLEEVLALPELRVVNCTGLGARELFGDPELTPIKGQLVVLLPQPEVDYITLAGASYMFPRSDGILLGGSQERGEWSTETTPTVVARILEGNRTVFEAMAGAHGDSRPG
jgi:D-amino-acid oxidase